MVMLFNKTPVYFELSDFNGTLKANESFIIKIKYYYYYDNSIALLIDSSIYLSIFDNKSLIYNNTYKTNSEGFLYVNISRASLGAFENDKNLTIKITYNGTCNLENRTLLLNSIIEQSRDLKLESNNSLSSLSLVFFPIFIIISITTGSLSLPLIIFNVNKKLKARKLSDLSFRY